MASKTKRTRLIRKRKHSNAGRKRKRRNTLHGTSKPAKTLFAD